jgi:hypothetical protein
MVDDVLGAYDGADMHTDDQAEFDSRRSSANLSHKSHKSHNSRDKHQHFRRALPHPNHNHSHSQNGEFTRPKGPQQHKFTSDPQQELLLRASPLPLPFTAERKGGGKGGSQWALSETERQSFLSSLMNVSMGSGAPSNSKGKQSGDLLLSPSHREAMTFEERSSHLRQPVDHCLAPLWEVVRDRGMGMGVGLSTQTLTFPQAGSGAEDGETMERLCFSQFDHSRSNEFNNRVALLRYEGVVSYLKNGYDISFYAAYVISTPFPPSL